VLGLHAALLATPVRSALSNGNASASHPIQVRMLAPPAVTAPVLAQAPAAVRQEANARAAPPAHLVVEPTPSVPEAQSAVPLVPEPLVELAPPMPVFGLIVPGIDHDDDYFPRALLTLAPSPIEPVLIEYPVIDRDPGHHSSELTLFIDETGRVVRVRVDGAELPFELEAAARNAFINARFRSGELDGRAVKSQIRIEVTFDGRSGNA
jgi:periplasmic protein TonB